MLIFIIIAIVTITTIIVMFLETVPEMEVGKDGKPKYHEAFVKWITNSNIIMDTKVTNIVLKTYVKGKENQDVLTTTIFTFDENDICIGRRVCIEGFTEEEIKEREGLKELSPKITNFRIENKKMIYSHNTWTGKTKEYIKEELEKHYDYGNIFEY